MLLCNWLETMFHLVLLQWFTLNFVETSQNSWLFDKLHTVKCFYRLNIIPSLKLAKLLGVAGTL